MNDCPSCGGSGQIQLFTSVVPCDCRRTPPKDSGQGRTFQQMMEAFPPGTHTLIVDEHSIDVYLKMLQWTPSAFADAVVERTEDIAKSGPVEITPAHTKSIFHCSSARITLDDGRTFDLGPGRVVFTPAD